jgi:hypothetical protein
VEVIDGTLAASKMMTMIELVNRLDKITLPPA